MSGRGCGGVGGVGGLVHGSSGKQPTSGIRGVLSEEGGAEGGVVGGSILSSGVRRIHQACGRVTCSDERRRHASTSAVEQRGGGGNRDAGGHDERVAPEWGGGAQRRGEGHPRGEQARNFPCKSTQSLNFWQGTGKEG